MKQSHDAWLWKKALTHWAMVLWPLIMGILVWFFFFVFAN